MKLFFFLVVSYFILSINANAQISTTDFGLKGRVNEVVLSTYTYVEKFGEFEVGKTYGYQILKFNEKGLLVKKYILHNKNTTADLGFGIGNKTEDIILNLTNYEYLYFDNGKLKEINVFETENFTNKKILKYKTKFKYDESGNFIDKRFYNGFDGSLISVSTDFTEILIAPDDSQPEDIRYFKDLEIGNMSRDDGLEKRHKIDKVDQFGNWVKKTEFLDDVQWFGFERKIVYYQ